MFLGSVREMGAGLESGVIDEDVDVSELRYGVGDEFLPVGNAADVALKSGDLSPQFANVRCHFFCSSLVGAIAKRDVRAFLREALGDRQPDPLASSRNCRHFSIQPVCHEVLLTILS